MLAVFCLRLALGLVAALLLLSPSQINPRFYRTHFLVVLGLTVVAAIFLRQTAALPLGVALAGSLLIAFAGSVVWSLEGTPGGRTMVVLSALTLATALLLTETNGVPATEYRSPHVRSDQEPSSSFAPGLASLVLCVSSLSAAAVLGMATTAMLLGHSYLIAPGMSIQPLMRLLAGLGIALVLRMTVAGVALGFWTTEHSLTNLNDETVLWLPVRWGLGLIGPLVLGWMAWQTARIRSTQSATGILYVVVVFCFLGELTSQLLLINTGYPL